MKQLVVVSNVLFVVGQRSDLERVRREKIRKHDNNPDISEEITRAMAAMNILYLPEVPS